RDWSSDVCSSDLSGIPEAAPPNHTPTANPSGILCRAIAMVNKVVRCKEDFGPSVFKKLRCKWGINLSKPKIKSAPRIKPIADGMTLLNPSPELISMAGANNDQKLAAIMTPPVKPSMPFSNFLLTPLKRNTPAAPTAVTPQV